MCGFAFYVEIRSAAKYFLYRFAFVFLYTRLTMDPNKSDEALKHALDLTSKKMLDALDKSNAEKMSASAKQALDVFRDMMMSWIGTISDHYTEEAYNAEPDRLAKRIELLRGVFSVNDKFLSDLVMACARTESMFWFPMFVSRVEENRVMLASNRTILVREKRRLCPLLLSKAVVSQLNVARSSITIPEMGLYYVSLDLNNLLNSIIDCSITVSADPSSNILNLSLSRRGMSALLKLMNQRTIQRLNSTPAGENKAKFLAERQEYITRYKDNHYFFASAIEHSIGLGLGILHSFNISPAGTSLLLGNPFFDKADKQSFPDDITTARIQVFNFDEAVHLIPPSMSRRAMQTQFTALVREDAFMPNRKTVRQGYNDALIIMGCFALQNRQHSSTIVDSMIPFKFTAADETRMNVIQ